MAVDALRRRRFLAGAGAAALRRRRLRRQPSWPSTPCDDAASWPAAGFSRCLATTTLRRSLLRRSLATTTLGRAPSWPVDALRRRRLAGALLRPVRRLTATPLGRRLLGGGRLPATPLGRRLLRGGRLTATPLRRCLRRRRLLPTPGGLLGGRLLRRAAPGGLPCRRLAGRGLPRPPLRRLPSCCLPGRALACTSLCRRHGHHLSLGFGSESFAMNARSQCSPI